MRWRILAAVAAGLLLPLPLLLSLGVASYLPSQPSTWKSREFSPVLSKEELRGFLTYQRDCEGQEDCESPLGCMAVHGTRGLCVASECQTDMQCADGYSCRTVSSVGDGPLIRFCVPEGTLAEGEPCSRLPRRASRACQAGLICNGYCGRPCHLEKPSSCPEGFICRDGASGPACAPTCEGRGCPTGQQCARVSRGISVCAAIHGEDCERHPCAEGQECATRYHPGQTGRITRECVTRCGDALPHCPDGTLCYASECRKPCEPDQPATCAAHQECRFHPADKLWLCGIQDGPVPP